MDHTEIPCLQPPNQLIPGFGDFVKEIKRQSIDKGAKFTEDELTAIFNGSFSGQVRAQFFLWIGDLNKIISVINIILTDLSELRKDRNSMKGNAVIRSEFLFQAFFSEFFKIREISRIFLKYLSKIEILDIKHKEDIVECYFKAFNWVYQVRNNFVHLGAGVKEDGINIDFSFLDSLKKEEKEKFISLLKESNTRENTIEIQCAIYIDIIKSIMQHFMGFQEVLSNTLAGLVVSFEQLNLHITVSQNES